MSRMLHKLKAREVAVLAKPGRHSDGGNLFLSIDGKGRRRWIFRYVRAGRVREMGLGSVRDVSLAEARGKAAEARLLLKEGKGPCRGQKVCQRG